MSVSLTNVAVPLVAVCIADVQPKRIGLEARSDGSNRGGQ